MAGVGKRGKRGRNNKPAVIKRAANRLIISKLPNFMVNTSR